MNFVAHVVAAAEHHDDPDALLGAALPDLVPVRHLDLDGLPAAVAAGIAHHRRADAAFHADARFTDLCRRIAGGLDEAGVRRGPARAAAHVGVELLLDAELLREDRASAAFRPVWERLRAPDRVVLHAVRPGDRDRWVEWLTTLTTRLDPWVHVGDHDVARRVAHVVARRPRLALDDRDRPTLTAVLGLARPAVAALPPLVSFAPPLGGGGQPAGATTTSGLAVPPRCGP